MKTWKLTLEYDGTKYSGWQEQNNARTVQGQLRKAAEDLFGSHVDIQGSGRTDAGVHARAQVAHLRLKPKAGGLKPKAGGKPRSLPADSILRGLNERLPADVCIIDVAEVHDNFHARHDAVSRTYLYQISKRRTAFFKKYVWWVKEPLDVEAMTRATQMLVGRHNFSAFRAPDPSKPDESPIVIVEAATIEVEGDLILFRITASHYLWRMVRRIAGVLVKVGKNELKIEDFERLLNGEIDRSMDVAAWTAPASGLFLESVVYPDEAR